MGCGDGSVVWYRNVGDSHSPRLAAAETLVPASTLGWKDDALRKPGQWGARAKVCVTDWNGDGKLDLLLGDICGGHLGKPAQTDAEKREEIAARDELPRLMEKWTRPTRSMATCGRRSPSRRTHARDDEQKVGGPARRDEADQGRDHRGPENPATVQAEIPVSWFRVAVPADRIQLS